MKGIRILICAMALFILLPVAVSCNAEKEATERRNLMMPKKSEMARNSRYKEVEKRKTNKHKVKKSKNKSLF